MIEPDDIPTWKATIDSFASDPASNRVAVLSQPASLAGLIDGEVWRMLSYIGEEEFELTGSRITPSNALVLTFLPPRSDGERMAGLSRIEVLAQKIPVLFPSLFLRIEEFSAKQDKAEVERIHDLIPDSPVAAETDSRFGSW